MHPMFPIRIIAGKAIIIAAMVFIGAFLCLAVSLPCADTSPTDNDEIETLGFNFCGRWIHVDVRMGDVEGYSQCKIIRMGSDLLGASKFVTVDDPTLKRLYAEMESVMSQIFGDDISDYDKARYILYFVQDRVQYMTDEELFGIEGYVQFPLETLYRGYGDCEDSAYLLMALYRIAGLDCVLAFMDGHVAVGVAVEDFDGEYVTKSFSDTKYYLAEPASHNDLGVSGNDYSFVADPTMTLILLLFYALGMALGEYMLMFLIRVF